jgi:hypothetical protein
LLLWLGKYVRKPTKWHFRRHPSEGHGNGPRLGLRKPCFVGFRRPPKSWVPAIQVLGYFQGFS